MRYLLIALLLLASTAHAALEMVGGATDKFLLVHLYTTAGADATGKAYTDMTITYTRNNASADADVTEATMTMGTHADGGFVEVDATNSPGLYQFGIPDAAIADGAEEVTITFAATGVVTMSKSISLIDVDLRAGPNVAANTVTVEGGDATDALGTPQSGDAYARIGAPAGTSLIDDLATATAATQGYVLAVKAKTDNLPAAPAAVGSPMTLENDAITAAKIAADAIGASELAASAVGASEVATGAVDADAIAADAATLLRSGVDIGSVAGEAVTGIGDFHTDLSGLGTITEIADAVWDEILSGHATAGTTGGALLRTKAAVYDSATRSGTVLTLSNSATQTVTTGGRVTAEP